MALSKVFCILVMSLAVTCSSARAATYSVVACGDAPRTVNHSWTQGNTAPSKLESGSACDDVGAYAGLYARDVLAVTNASPGDTAGWAFTAPAGTSITQVSYSRWLYKEDDNDWVPALTVDGEVFETCSIVYPAVRCNVGSEGGQRTITPIAAARQVRVGVLCQPNAANACGGGGTLHAVAAVLYGATVTLSDAARPSVPDVAGLDGLYVAGGATPIFTASDNTGIRAARIYVDGALQTTTTFACDFTYAVPCSDKSGAEVSLDTRSVADGSHGIQIAVVDPAGNETRSSSRTVVVDNSAPLPPQGLAVEGGADWRSGNSFDVSWANPADAGSPVAVAHYVLCAIDGSDCQPERQVSGSGLSRLTGISVPFQGEWGLRVWLEDAAGNVDAANSAEVTLRYGSPPAPPVVEPAAAPAPAPADSTPIASDPLALPPLVAPEPSAATAVARRDPLLRLSRSTLRDGRLVVRGRVASGTTGSVALTIRVRHGHTIRRRVTVRANHFKLVLRARHGAVLARFPGNSVFRPARATLRF